MLVAILATIALNTTVAIGVPNPAVTQKTISHTICDTKKYVKLADGSLKEDANGNSWVYWQRPSVYFTNKLKTALVGKYYPGHSLNEFELDHVISLEAGGSPDDQRNLRLQKWDDARNKDTLENQVHKDICSHKITLRQGQAKLKSWSYTK